MIKEGLIKLLKGKNLEIINKVIVVTGGAGGIGFAIAKEFIKESPKIVILVDISFKNFNFKDEKILCEECDVTNELSFQNLIDKRRSN